MTGITDASWFAWCFALCLLSMPAPPPGPPPPGPPAADDPLFVPRHFAAGSAPQRIAAGDLDGDLLPDAVVSTELETRVLLHDGPSALAAPLISDGAARDQLLADLDGNGTLDLVQARALVTIGVPAGLYVRLGQGDGTFAPAVGYEVDGSPADVAAGDVNGDGIVDLLSCGDAFRGTLRLGLGDGTFSAELHFGPVDLGATAQSATLDVGDVDGDHLDDVVALGFWDGTLRVFLSNGDGTFAAPLTVALSVGHRDPRLGDYDGDGDLDVAFDKGSFQLHVIANDGRGTFFGSAIIPLPIGWFPSDLRVGDLNEDGRADLVVSVGPSATADDAVGVVLGEPALAFAAPRWYGAGVNPTGIAVADVNRDGDLDVLSADKGSGTVSVLWGEGDGTLRPAYHAAPMPEFLEHGDLDEDGLQDLVAASHNGTITTLRGLGNGRFAPGVTVETGLSVTGLLLRDMNGDGHLDAVASGGPIAGGRLITRLGDGHGAFGASVTTTLPDGVQGFDVGDVDEDGRLDVVAFDEENTQLLIEHGNGDGSFSLINTIQGGGSTNGMGRCVLVRQFVGASHLDLFVVANVPGFFTGQLLRLEGHGDGTFGAPLTVDTFSFLDEITAADMDGDGDLDIVGVAQAPDSNSYILANQSIPSFWGAKAFGAGESPHAPTVADVDGDGMLDVLTADAHFGTGGTVSFMHGFGNGSLAVPQQVVVGDFPDALAVADFDGDAHLDVAVAAGGPDAIEVLVNQHGVWDDLGFPLAGAQGLPRMLGIGSLLPGTPVELPLHDAVPGGATALVVGIAELQAPFKGGVLVPLPVAILYPLPTNAQGDLPLAGTWPPGIGSGLSWYFQYWSPDTAGPHGFSASNSVRGVTP